MVALLAAMPAPAAPDVLWQIGRSDDSAGEFALAPNNYGAFNAAGVSTDIDLSLMLTMPDADSGSPVSPLSRQSLPPGARCATVGQTTTCELKLTEP